MVALTVVTDPNDPTAIQVPLSLSPNVLQFAQDLPGAPSKVCFFARIASGWVAGPVVSCDFSPTWVQPFNDKKAWAAETLQRLALEGNPIPARPIQVRVAYPRDDMPIPSISVEFDAAPPAQALLGDLGGAPGAALSNETLPWNASFTFTLWSNTPEDRDILRPWFQQACHALKALCPYQGINEPSMSFSTSEDFSGQIADEPLFIVSCNLSGMLWSSMDLPEHNYVGHLTV